MAPHEHRSAGTPTDHAPSGASTTIYRFAWYSYAMRITIDSAGRLVIPKALRDAVGIVAGGTVEATLRDGRIELEVPPAEVRVERRGRVCVALPNTPTPPLRSDDVQATVDALRTER